MNNEEFDFAGKFDEEFRKIRSNTKKPNILVCGGTGAGKSTLIQGTISDAAIRAKVKVGAGKPVTQTMERYVGDVVVIYDSPGYESGSESQSRYQELVMNSIFDSRESAENRIHMVWYCISQGNHRIFDIDESTIKKIQSERIPVAVVLTQADKVTQEESDILIREIKNACGIDAIFETSSKPETGLSLTPLLDWTAENIEPALRTAFISGSTIGIEKKKEEGNSVVLQHILSAATIAATPIPLSDAPLLLSNQATLVARLASLWDLPSISTLAKGVLASTAVSTAGKTLAGSLLKLTGVGAIIGGAINAAVASSLTAGIGYGLNEMLAMMARDELAGKKADLDYYLGKLPGLIEIFKSKQSQALEEPA